MEPPQEIGDSQQDNIKPTVEEEENDDLYDVPPDTAAKVTDTEAKKDENFKFEEKPQAPVAAAPQSFDRPPTRWSSRVPTTSPKFELLKYANKLVKTDNQLIQFVYKCEFRGKGGEILVPEDGTNSSFLTRYNTAINPRGRFQPVFGLLRMVLPSGAHHIVPYLINGTGHTPTIWFLEQYDTTFWWLYKNPDWYKTVANNMIKDAVGVRAYVAAADKITKDKRIKYRDIPDITGNSVDLQKDSSDTSAETCVPWALVILKYLVEPRSIGLDGDLKIRNLGGVTQDDFNTMYEVLNINRDYMLMWVRGTIHHKGGKRRTRRRRQTRRKTKRSRK